MNIDERLTRVGEIEKQIAALHAEQLRLIAAIHEDPCDGAPVPKLEKHFVIEELRAILGVSANWVRNKISTATMLTQTLTGALTALEKGELTLRHAEALCDAVAGLPVEDAVDVEAASVPFAAGRDYTAFVRKVHREVLALDSRTTEERYRAAIEGRRIWCGANTEGATATFGAVLSAEGAQTLMSAIDTAAKDRPTGDTRTSAQRKADGLVRIAQDWLNGIASAGKQVGPSVQVTIAASTLLGLDNQPGELDGHGPIPAAIARAIAADPTGTWRRLITDDQGHLIDYGRTVYEPPKPLADFVRARDRECVFPACHRQASSCELDHRRPWHKGGPTNAGNLDDLCPRHHHLKDETEWTTERLPDDTVRWTSPTGRSYDNPPATYPTTVTPDPTTSDIVVSDDTNEANPDEAEPPAETPLGA
jgi:hypothetical protein